MDPNIFRKLDAPSCLVVDKTWEQVVNKPYDFNELVERVVNMMLEAEKTGELLSTTTLGELKDAINTILLGPLQKETGGSDNPSDTSTTDSIPADAFWDEIKQTNENWARLKEAIARAYDMKQQIAERKPLTEKDTLGSTKTNFNETVVKPMLGINEDE